MFKSGTQLVIRAAKPFLSPNPGNVINKFSKLEFGKSFIC
jgi:hypothetical protein